MDIEKKQFILPKAICDALDGVAEGLGGKGNLKRIGAAGLLMFLHATEDERKSYILWGDAIALGSASIREPPQVSALASLRLPARDVAIKQCRIPLKPWNDRISLTSEPCRIVDVGVLSSGAVHRDECVPILQPVRGGKPTAPRDGDHNAGFSDDFVVFSANDPAACAIQVEGRYMMDLFNHGDLAVVSPRLAKSFKSGMLGVVSFRDGRPYVCRQVKRARGRVALHSLQGDFGPEMIDEADVESIYPVVLCVQR